MSDISGNGYQVCETCGWNNERLYLHPKQCEGTVVKQDKPIELAPVEQIIVTPDETVEIRETSSTGGQKGVKLERYDLIPVGPLEELARHYGQGAKKYEGHQWRKGYKWTNSFSAMMRHAWDWLRGKDYDTCDAAKGKGCAFVDNMGNPIDWAVPGKICYNHTGGHQMVCVAWHAFTLLEFKETHIGHDDRYKGEVNE